MMSGVAGWDARFLVGQGRGQVFLLTLTQMTVIATSTPLHSIRTNNTLAFYPISQELNAIAYGNAAGIYELFYSKLNSFETGVS